MDRFTDKAIKRICRRHRRFLRNANYEVIKTPRLGWIVIRTDYRSYSNPIRQIYSVKDLIEYMKTVK